MSAADALISQQILECLKRTSFPDLSITEIAGLTRLYRTTVSRYVHALEKEGKIIKTRHLGRNKLYMLRRKANAQPHSE